MSKILVAVTDPDERALCVFALRFAGHHLSSTNSAGQLLPKIVQYKPDLLVLEAFLLKANETSAGVDLENSPELAQRRVIYLLEANDKQTIAEINATTHVDYLLKPVSPDQLILKVTALLKKTGKSR